ncbi:GxxExxY protein [Geothrix fermentans]|uniref:GxxExxY protein n=1 Tax=Geothrix fermentans TaxID=44676 RepID=UPI000425B560|nr:GxxExxY protein [Geothrix fermentans]
MADLDAITERIRGCAFKVSAGLGPGFLEKLYENALVIELERAGLRVARQHPLAVWYDGIQIGQFAADLLVEDQILVELKAVRALEDLHLAQALNYLRASLLPACLLLNFGTPKLEIRRLHPSPSWPRPAAKEPTA